MGRMALLLSGALALSGEAPKKGPIPPWFHDRDKH